MLGAKVAVYLDGGPSATGVPSTILDATGTTPRILRAGGVSLDAAHVQQHDRTSGRGRLAVREYLVVFGIALGVTYLLASIARQLAVRFGAVARVRDRDVHAIPTPYFGGPAMFGGLLAAYAVAMHLPFLSLADSTVFGPVRGVLLGGAVICLVGVIDDLYELDALSKFAGQVLAAIIVVTQGVQFFYLPLYGNYLGLDQTQAMIFTVILIVGTANAVNFVDGLDGLAAGIVAIGAVAFFAYAFVLAVENGETRAIAAALLTAALAGACIGILPHNFFPARMFIGDSGSMLIGFVLACSSISLTGQFPATSLSEGVGGAEAELPPGLAAAAAPVHDPAGAVHRSRSGCHPAHPRRPFAIQPRQDAHPSPAARDRSLPPPSGVVDVRRGGSRRLRQRRHQPVQRLAVDRRIRRPRSADSGGSFRAPEARREGLVLEAAQVGAPPALVITFTNRLRASLVTPNHRGWPPKMTTNNER